MRILKFLSAGFVAALLLSSCLGDSNNTVKYTSVFAYKGQDLQTGLQSVLRLYDGQATQVTFDGIDSKLNDGDCVELGLTLTNTSSGGVLIAEDVVIDPKNIYSATEQAVYTQRAVPTEREEIYPSALSIPVRYADDFLGDRWMFNATTRTDEPSSYVEVQFFYDPDNQRVYIEDEKGNVLKDEACDKNQVIIDVRFFKTEASSGYGTILDVSKDKNNHKFVANFSEARYDIKYSEIFDQTKAEEQKYTDMYYTYVAVMFRYHQQKEADKPMLPTYLGSWEPTGSSSNNIFNFFAFLKNQ